MREITVAATQMACSWDRNANVRMAESLVRRAAAQGADIVLLPELFETPYFPKDQKVEFFALAAPLDSHPAVAHFSALARELNVVLPLSVFERANTAFFNSLVVIDAGGRIVGFYRKSHIPDGPGYQEKFYFNPGDTGFRTFATRPGVLGAAVCWDQWFPEVARVLALKGAEILFYPTAIGSEPAPASPVDSRAHWQRVMQGHAAANMVPVVASNRFGREVGEAAEITFYGSSFIAGPTGEIVAQAGVDADEVIVARFDLDALSERRRSWGLFRDRRPDLYGPLGTLDGGS